MTTQQKTPLRRRLWKKFIDAVMTPVIRFLYRHRLQKLVGGLMIVLTHTGRKSGKVRKTVLFAKKYDPATRQLWLVSAFGVTDWYRNICVQPALRVEIGGVEYVPNQRILTAEEVVELEREFRSKFPVVARAQAWLMCWKWRLNEVEFLEHAARLPGVLLSPNGTTE